MLIYSPTAHHTAHDVGNHGINVHSVPIIEYIAHGTGTVDEAHVSFRAINGGRKTTREQIKRDTKRQAFFKQQNSTLPIFNA